MPIVFVNQIIVGNFDDSIRRYVNKVGSEANGGSDFFQGKYTSLQNGYNFTLFKVLVFPGPDFDLIPQRQLRILVKRKYFIRVRAKVLNLLLDDFLYTQGIGLALLAQLQTLLVLTKSLLV